jgi:hypothetical protein
MTTRVASCVCGRVKCTAIGQPIVSGVCCRDDCQKAASEIEALANSARFRDADGGAPYLTYRDDWFSCSAGEDLLVGYGLTKDARRGRFVASCCNSAIFLKFAPGHWVSAYRARFEGEAPPLEKRTQTRFRRADTDLPTGVPSYRGFGLKLLTRLIATRISMLLGD